MLKFVKDLRKDLESVIGFKIKEQCDLDLDEGVVRKHRRKNRRKK